MPKHGLLLLWSLFATATLATASRPKPQGMRLYSDRKFNYWCIPKHEFQIGCGNDASMGLEHVRVQYLYKLKGYSCSSHSIGWVTQNSNGGFEIGEMCLDGPRSTWMSVDDFDGVWMDIRATCGQEKCRAVQEILNCTDGSYDRSTKFECSIEKNYPAGDKCGV